MPDYKWLILLLLTALATTGVELHFKDEEDMHKQGYVQ